MRKLHKVCLAACLAGLAGAEALAGQVAATFEGTGRGRGGVDISMAGHGSVNNLFTGQLKWNVTSSTQPGITPGPMITFCTDIYQFVSDGTFDIVDLEDAPDGTIGGMGPTKAALVGHLYSRYYADVDDASADRDQASAFQVAIWEIVNEDLSNGLDVSSGDFEASGLTTDASSFLSTMLSEVADAWSDDRLENAYHLVGAVGNGQDQIMIVPVPPAVWLAGAGLLGVGVMRRRRTGHVRKARE